MHIHILGICGTFMGGLAALARECGHKVTGCDASVYPPMSDQLRALGIELIEGFDDGQMALKPDVYVVGNVVSRARLADGTPKFPLMEAVMAAGLPYTSGPQWLAEHVLQGRHVLAVAGTHGKTTTTAMLTWILECAGLQPGFLVGGVPLNFGVSARLGNVAPTLPHLVSSLPPEGANFGFAAVPEPRGGPSKNCGSPYFVIEADEYDTAFFDKRSKFVHYRPRTAVLNNLEFDHADIFDDLGQIERQFHHLVRTVPGSSETGAVANADTPVSGRIVVNGLEESLQRVLSQGCWSDVRSFGAAVSDFTAQGDASDFAVMHNGQQAGNVKWALTGVHNQLNALAAIAAAEHVGVTVEAACKALESFQNVKRRMEVRGRVHMSGDVSSPEVTVYDDFAHHPTAIRTTVDGLRRNIDAVDAPDAGLAAHGTASSQPRHRILAVFEPRSNTMKLGAMKAQLPWSLQSADMAFCHSGGLGWDAREALASMGESARVADTIDALVALVRSEARPGDHILCMSNGGFGGIHAKLLDALVTQ